MVRVLSQSPGLIHQFLGELRDANIQKDRMRFRRNIERIGEIAANEISKTLTYTEREVVTPLGIASMQALERQPVICSIMRAGLPLHQGILNYYDQADSGFIAAYRKHLTADTFEIEVDYLSCGSLDNRILILADPMLATGASGPWEWWNRGSPQMQEPWSVRRSIWISTPKPGGVVVSAAGMSTGPALSTLVLSRWR